MKELPEVINNLVAAFGELPEVVAVALGGSRSTGAKDQLSDFDLYVYTSEEISPTKRHKIANKFADQQSRIEIDNRFAEPGDEWSVLLEGKAVGVDLMYRHPNWIEDQLERVLVRHEASTGYSTCFWFNVLHSRSLYDPSGWFDSLQAKARQPYPEPLRQAIFAKNYPRLRQQISSYSQQIEKAFRRQDWVGVHGRFTALLVSYFDVLFAFNRQPHPGEKRLLMLTRQNCPQLPRQFEENINKLLSLAPSPQTETTFLDNLNSLLDNLDELIK